MENRELNSLILSNGAELTRGTQIAAIEDFDVGSSGSAKHTAGETYEVTSLELAPQEQTVIVFLDGAPVDMLDLGALETRLESRELAIVEPRPTAGTW